MISDAICAMVRLLCGATANWRGCAPEHRQRVYFANHASHLDFLLIWAALPPEVRASTRPVAGREYWTRNKLRTFLADGVFRAVLIDREHVTRKNNPMDAMREALGAGDSLIVFPEGTRSSDGSLQAFRSGLYHLWRAARHVEFVPVYLENLNRILPKGEFLVVPLLSSVTFGRPLAAVEGEGRDHFLARARQELETVRKP